MACLVCVSDCMPPGPLTGRRLAWTGAILLILEKQSHSGTKPIGCSFNFILIINMM